MFAILSLDPKLIARATLTYRGSRASRHHAEGLQSALVKRHSQTVEFEAAGFPVQAGLAPVCVSSHVVLPLAARCSFSVRMSSRNSPIIGSAATLARRHGDLCIALAHRSSL